MPLTDLDKSLHALVKRKVLPHQIQNLTQEIRSVILRGANVNSLTEEGTPLLQAVNNNYFEIVKVLVEAGADINLTDTQFNTPLSLAKLNYNILNYLIENHKSIPLVAANNVTVLQLENIISFCKEQFSNQRDHDQALFDYAVSRLTGENIYEHRKIEGDKHSSNWKKYVGHLHSLAAIDKKSKQVEGFLPENFLPLRIRSLFEIILKIETGIITQQQLLREVTLNKDFTDNRKLILDRLKKELLIEMSTLHVVKCLRIQFTDCKVLAKNILGKIITLNDQEEFCIASGWYIIREGKRLTHTVYININKFDRIDNLGDGTEQEYIDVSQSHVKKYLHVREDTNVYPCILGPAPIARLDYLTNVLVCAQFKKIKDEAISLIYRRSANKEASILDAKYLGASALQSVANCTVEGHNVGLRLRLADKSFYDWLRREESAVIEPNLSNYEQSKLDKAQIEKFWNAEQRPRGLPLYFCQILKNQYLKEKDIIIKNHRMSVENFSFQFIRKDQLQLDDTSSDNTLQTTEQKLLEPISPNDLFINCSDDIKRILITASSGKGKSTFCVIASILWATNNLWPQYKWLFIVSLRNLIKENYPPKNSAYTFIDILKQECIDKQSQETLQTINQENQKEMLLIIDGGNELSCPEYLKNAVNELMALQNVIVTSTNSTVPYFKPSLHVEISDLQNKDIEIYVSELLKQKLIDSSEFEQLLSLFKENTYVGNLANSPMNLRLICELKSTEIETTTDIYQEVFFNHLISYKEKLKDNNIKKLGIERCCESEIKALGLIAILSLQQENSYIFNGNIIEIAFNLLGIRNQPKHSGLFYPLSPLDNLLSIGFLKQAGKNLYTFSHPLFQSFLAAYYIFVCMNTGLNKIIDEDITAFIAKNKFDSKFESVWPFVAGILSKNNYIQDLEKFLEFMKNPTIDVYNLRKCCLLMQCIEQVKQNKLAIIESISHTIGHWLERAINDDHLELSSYFIRHLNICPKVAGLNLITEIWLKYLRNPGNTYLRRSAISKLLEIKTALLSREIINEFFTLINTTYGDGILINALCFKLAEKAVNNPAILSSYLTYDFYFHGDIYNNTKRNLKKLNYDNPEILKVLSKFPRSILRLLDIEPLIKIAKYSNDFLAHLINIADDAEEYFLREAPHSSNYKAIIVLLKLGQSKPLHIKHLINILTNSYDYVITEVIEVIGNNGIKAKELVEPLYANLNHGSWLVRAAAIKTLAMLNLIEPANYEIILTRLDDSIVSVAYPIIFTLAKNDINFLSSLFVHLMSQTIYDYYTQRYIAMIDTKVWEEVFINLCSQYHEFLILLNQAVTRLSLPCQEKIKQKFVSFDTFFDFKSDTILLNTFAITDADIRLNVFNIDKLFTISHDILNKLLGIYIGTFKGEVKTSIEIIFAKLVNNGLLNLDNLFEINLELGIKISLRLGKATEKQINNMKSIIIANNNHANNHLILNALKTLDSEFQVFMSNLIITSKEEVQKILKRYINFLEPQALLGIYIIRPDRIWLKAMLRIINTHSFRVELENRGLRFNRQNYIEIPIHIFNQFMNDWRSTLVEEEVQVNIISTSMELATAPTELILDSQQRLKIYAAGLIEECNPFDIVANANRTFITLSQTATGMNLTTIIEKLNILVDILFYVTDGKINSTICKIANDCLIIELPSSDEAIALVKNFEHAGFITDGKPKAEKFISNKIRCTGIIK